jgi:diguanylate cyclase (GGDEF)-like protein/PAS domain S-box-containing protein
LGGGHVYNGFMYEYTPYVLPFIVSTAILSYIFIYSYRLRKQVEVAGEFSIMVLTMLIWTICYALELVSTTLDGKIFWTTIKYLGSGAGPTAFFVFSLYYTNNQKWFTPTLRWVFPIYVLITVIIVFTNPLHHWFWTEITMVEGLPETQSEHGFYFWIYAVLSYVFILGSVVVYYIHYLRVAPLFRRQAILMLLGGFVPFVVRVPEDFLGWDIVPNLDNIIVFFLVSAILFFIAIFRLNALEILPIAHDLIVKNINSGILVLNTTGRVVEINPYAETLIHAKSGNVIGEGLNEVLKDWPQLDYSPHLESQVEQEISLDHRDGKKYFLVQISPIQNQRNVLIGHIIVLVDITERKFAEMELARLARTDVLTGVTNRRYFFELAENEYQRFLRYQHALTIILFDIDHFKQVNDRYGHHAGDHVLKHFASRSQNMLRTSDVFARYGGEEFIALLIETTQESALETAERIRREIQSLQINFEGTPIPITTSIGLAFAEPDAKLEKLIDMADKALYQSKQNGRNQVTIWRS